SRVLPCFVSFAWQSRDHARFAPAAAACGNVVPGVVHPVSPSGHSSMETTGSPKFLGNLDCPSARVLADAGRTDRTRPLRCSSAAPGPPGAKAPTKGL